LARRLLPRFTRGMGVLLFYFNVLAAGGKDDSPWRRSLASSHTCGLMPAEPSA
jgi:hypothetical protein